MPCVGIQLASETMSEFILRIEIGVVYQYDNMQNNIIHKMFLCVSVGVGQGIKTLHENVGFYVLCLL